MAEFRRGLKAGIIAGLISGLLIGLILTGLNLTVFNDHIKEIIEYSINQEEKRTGQLIPIDTKDTILFIVTYGMIMGSTITGISSGIILGLVLGGLYNIIPGKTPITKGLILSMCWWIIGISLSSIIQSTFSTEEITQNTIYRTVDYTASLIGQILLGYLLGRFWIKFKP